MLRYDLRNETSRYFFIVALVGVGSVVCGSGRTGYGKGDDGEGIALSFL